MHRVRTLCFTAEELVKLDTGKLTIRRPIHVPQWWQGHRIYSKIYDRASGGKGVSIGCEVLLSDPKGGAQRRCPYGSPGDWLVGAKLKAPGIFPTLAYVTDVDLEYVTWDGNVFEHFSEFDAYLDSTPEAEVEGRWIINLCKARI